MSTMRQPVALLGRRVTWLAGDIKLSHSVFALPFALLATFLAAGSSPPAGELPRGSVLALIVGCMILARTMAMSMNRWADARIDAANPRTAHRAIPSGRLPGGFVLLAAGLCAGGFLVTTGAFWWVADNPWPLILAPLVLAYLAGYSFTKRFTWGCHFVLGSALALSPLAAGVAVRPAYLADPPVYLLAGVVTGWVAGFDVIYALQDEAVDRAQGLYSLPARFHARRAIWISRGLHAAAVAGLVGLVLLSAQLAVGFAAAATLAAGLLVLEHALIAASPLHRIPLIFVTINGMISLLLGVAGIADVVWRIGRIP